MATLAGIVIGRVVHRRDRQVAADDDLIERKATGEEPAAEDDPDHRAVARGITLVMDGVVTPTATTAGGHHRWDVEDLREQVKRAARERKDLV